MGLKFVIERQGRAVGWAQGSGSRCRDAVAAEGSSREHSQAFGRLTTVVRRARRALQQGGCALQHHEEGQMSFMPSPAEVLMCGVEGCSGSSSTNRPSGSCAVCSTAEYSKSRGRSRGASRC